MSVEPRNGLWNRLLARAEARARQERPLELHHYCPRSASDDHLRTSLENSLVYHGLKIETEFNLPLQRPPRKRKAKVTKRKRDLPTAARLRNDCVAAGSPGPTHRAPAGTPARRISKSTPLSRLPIPPISPVPPVPPIPTTTRAAAARERVLSAVSDDDESPVRGGDRVTELSDSSDRNDVFLARTTKPDGGAVIVLPRFDQAANSNDTSSWEDDAILVEPPPAKEQDFDEDVTNVPELDERALTGVSPVFNLGPAYKTSRYDRARRAKARKIANSDSSPARDSDSRKSGGENDSIDKTEGSVQEPEKAVKGVQRPTTEEKSMMRKRKGTDTTTQVNSKLKKDATFRKNDMPENIEESKEDNHSLALCPRNTLLNEDLRARIKKLTMKRTNDERESSPIPVISISSSSDDERITPPRRRSRPIRTLPPRCPSPSVVTVEDKLFGPLSPLSSPRRRTRSMSQSEKHLSQSDRDSSIVE